MDSTQTKEFIESIDTLARNKDDFVLNHYGPLKSAIIMGTIFKYSKNEVKMFVGNFNGAISNNEYYLKNLEDFIQRGGKVRVLIQKIEQIVPTKAYQLLSRYEGLNENGEKRVQIILTNEKVIVDLDNEKKDIHFTIGDEKLFRVESDIKEYNGHASFNAPDVVEALDNIFEKIKKKELSLGSY